MTLPLIFAGLPAYSFYSKNAGKITLLHTLDLTRFNTYAPWVRQLEALNRMTVYQFRIHTRLTSTIAKRPLLPNLRILSLSGKLEVPLGDYESILELFVCPSLVEIRHKSDSGSTHYLKPSAACLLIQKISAVCPGIQKLGFYPDDDNVSRNDSSSLAFSPDAAFLESMAGFLNLRSFSSTGSILKPAVLKALGVLPLSSTLAISDYCSRGPRNPTFEKDPRVVDALFPSLRNLQIYALNPRDITAIWTQPWLVLNLRTVTIQCCPDTPVPNRLNGERKTPAGQKWINTFLAKLPRKSPHIEELDLQFNTYPRDRRPYPLSGARQHLLRLPLRRVQLQIDDSTVKL